MQISQNPVIEIKTLNHINMWLNSLIYYITNNTIHKIKNIPPHFELPTSCHSYLHIPCPRIRSSHNPRITNPRITNPRIRSSHNQSFQTLPHYLSIILTIKSLQSPSYNSPPPSNPFFYFYSHHILLNKSFPTYYSS